MTMTSARQTISHLVITTIIMLIFCATRAAEAGYVTIPGASNGSFNVKVISTKEAHFRTTFRQQYDFSCGSAVVATLLTHHYDAPVSEQAVFREMFDKGDKAKISREGFSLLDIKDYLERHGYQADGYRIPLETFRKLGVPAIVLITQNGFKHFVVVKGISDKEVLVGDPSFGLNALPRPKFEQMWNKLIFLIRNKKDIGERNFNRSDEWHVTNKAPVGTTANFGQPLNILTLHLSSKPGL